MLVPASVVHASYGPCRVVWLLVAAQSAQTQAEARQRYGLTWEIGGLTREIGARGWKLGWHEARRSPQLRRSLLAR